MGPQAAILRHPKERNPARGQSQWSFILKLNELISWAGPSASEFRQLLAPGKNKPELAPLGPAYTLQLAGTR
jgi:hypothetical protein